LSSLIALFELGPNQAVWVRVVESDHRFARRHGIIKFHFSITLAFRALAPIPTSFHNDIVVAIVDYSADEWMSARRGRSAEQIEAFHGHRSQTGKFNLGHEFGGRGSFPLIPRF